MLPSQILDYAKQHGMTVFLGLWLDNNNSTNEQVRATSCRRLLSGPLLPSRESVLADAQHLLCMPTDIAAAATHGTAPATRPHSLSALHQGSLTLSQLCQTLQPAYIECTASPSSG
jgi:hypothetical protein